MGQNKLEKEFRTKLNAREIEPSAQAWDRLDAMLTVGEEKKPVPVRKLNWLYIAAGIVGFLFIGLMFYNNRGTMGETKTAVAVEGKTTEKPADSNGNEDSSTSEQAQQNQIHPVKDILLEPLPTQQSERSVASTAVQKSANHSNPQQKQTLEKMAVQKQETALAANENHQNQNNQLQKNPINPVKTNANVDELLASATQEKAAKKPSLKVDASSLLSQVDGELELSFREKAINTLGKKYQNVKVALANRNNQD